MKKEYYKPEIHTVTLDNAISLQLASETPTTASNFEIGGISGKSNTQRVDPYEYDEW